MIVNSIHLGACMTNAVNVAKDVAKDQAYVVPFEQLRMTDVDIVGGKNASLGEMISQLAGAGVRVPTRFRHHGARLSRLPRSTTT